MLLFSTPDAPEVKDTRFPIGVGSGFERIYGVNEIPEDVRVSRRLFAPKSSVDGGDPEMSVRKAQQEPNERKG